MKKILTLAMASAFTLAIVGCHASGEIEGDKDHDTYSKKTTTVDNDGDRTVKTEVKKTDND
jgi:hypothetical protein